MTPRNRLYFTAMALYWLGFGLGTTFYPKMLQMFMTAEGVAASTPFVAHVWFHGGLDILSVVALLFALSRMPEGKPAYLAGAVVGLLPTIAIVYSVVATPYWSPLFIGPSLGCLAFGIWGLVLAGKVDGASAA